MAYLQNNYKCYLLFKKKKKKFKIIYPYSFPPRNIKEWSQFIIVPKCFMEFTIREWLILEINICFNIKNRANQKAKHSFHLLVLNKFKIWVHTSNMFCSTFPFRQILPDLWISNFVREIPNTGSISLIIYSKFNGKFKKMSVCGIFLVIFRTYKILWNIICHHFVILFWHPNQSHIL